jgi:4-deoxy-L-threo-5-hexosulose-uronate ketol-isomerase
LLPTHKELASNYFAERREIGVLTIGGLGSIRVDGEVYNLEHLDSLYIGRGSEVIELVSEDSCEPAKFYCISYPAHTRYETRLVRKAEARQMAMGAQNSCNQRVIYQAIRPGIVQSCQLVMGFTALAEGNVWNTMPPHTHKRRSEIYMYFGLQENARVFHLMGDPEETRSLVMREGEAIISPSWSIHSGAGMSNYTFVWAMGGENQVFEDMDGIEIERLG